MLRSLRRVVGLELTPVLNIPLNECPTDNTPTGYCISLCVFYSVRSDNAVRCGSTLTTRRDLYHKQCVWLKYFFIRRRGGAPGGAPQTGLD